MTICVLPFTDIKCQPLDTPPNSILLGVPANTEATVGTVAEFMCPIGSTLDDDNVILCQSDGTWSGPIPTCNPLGTTNNYYIMLFCALKFAMVFVFMYR